MNMYTLCLNCGTEDAEQELPCRVCGCMRHALTTQVQAGVHKEDSKKPTNAVPIAIAEMGESLPLDLQLGRDHEIPSEAVNLSPAATVLIDSRDLQDNIKKPISAKSTKRPWRIDNQKMNLLYSGLALLFLVIAGINSKFFQKLLPGPTQSSVATPLPLGGSSQGYAILAPTVRIGDKYTYETIDLIEPKLNNVTTREVIEVSSSGFTMEFVNAGSKYTRRLSYDSNLNLMSTRSGENQGLNYSPALQYFKFPLRSGEKWSSSSTEVNIKTGKTRTHNLSGSVGVLEQITVPAGTFRAFRIIIQSELIDEGKISTGQDVSWYSPDVRRTVKSDLESRDATGRSGRRQVSLVSYILK